MNLLAIPLFLLTSVPAFAEDGYRLWLRHEALAEPPSWSTIVAPKALDLAAGELATGMAGLLGHELKRAEAPGEGALILGTPKTSPWIASLGWEKELAGLGDDGFVIRMAKLRGHPTLVIASQGKVGCLYGAFHLLRVLGQGWVPHTLDVSSSPKIRRRLLNHWDNLDRSIERGYAGKSLWNWDELPAVVDPRLTDYARANASLGINGTVLNNVNCNPGILRPGYLAKVKAIADTLRPWGLRVYLSVNFGTPKAFGDTPTADPLDASVGRWWKKKAAEIYTLIPDFGGFLVKANSEGQPGPLDYGRSHADGANMLATALRPFGGVVIWRAFVYNAGVAHDRAKRAYLELMPLDGKFSDNVFIQAKNGPLDFQPREPFHPLFTALRKTKIGAELQITQEYLGHSTHLAYLGTMWEEFFKASGEGWRSGKDSLIAGVANTGTDRNWCGHDLAQANWYAYGRLAWDPGLSAEALAKEWASQTFFSSVRDRNAHGALTAMLMRSRQAVVDYSSPLGLAGVFERDIHYAPDPGMVDERHDDWSAAYFVRAAKDGLGYDRTRAGSGAVDQYEKTLADQFNDAKTCPEDYLLWFHHVPWKRPLGSGKTLWDELQARFARGVKAAEGLRDDWKTLKGLVDEERFEAISAKLDQQAKDAKAWAASSLKYYRGVKDGKILGHPFGPSW